MTAQVWEWDGKWTEASSTPFICNLFTTQYDRNICILICLVLPAIICLYILRMSSNPSQYILLVVVCESNIIFWSSVIYLIVTHSCSGSRGKELVVPALISTFFINIPAALYNDHFFPDAKMTLREAKAFFSQIKNAKPVIKLLGGFNSDANRVEAVYPVESWRDSTDYPSFGSHNTTSRTERFFKISLNIESEDDTTENDFKNFIHQFRLNKSYINKVKIVSAISGRSTSTSSTESVKFPSLQSEKTLRLFIISRGHVDLMETFIKTAWIPNVFGAAGLVMAGFLMIRSETKDIVIEKTFKSFSSTPLPDYLVNNNSARDQSVSTSRASGGGNDGGSESLDDIIPPLVRHQILHTPVCDLIDGLNNTTRSSDMPPSYSLLDLEEPPKYDEVTEVDH